MSHRYDLLHHDRSICILLGGSGILPACREQASLSALPRDQALTVGIQQSPAKARLLSSWPQMPHTCRLLCPARPRLSWYAMALASLFHVSVSKLPQWAARSHPCVNLANKQGG
jgi:hypothetical protein